MRLILFAAALLVASPAFAQSKDEAAALQDALARGRMIYAYDQAAWHGTDDMVAKIKDPRSKLGGWIVDGPAEAAELIFYDKDTRDPHAVYVASFRSGKLASSRVLGAADDRSLTPLRKRMIAAAGAASAALQASNPARCSEQSFNTVVLPPATADSAISVYFLVPQPDMKTIPFGGHYRIDVAADGKAGPVRPFTRSCIALDSEAKPPEKAGQPAALMISHLLDPTPTEIHVFSSLAAKQTVYVLTPSERIWAVRQGLAIEPIDRGKQDEKSAPATPPTG